MKKKVKQSLLLALSISTFSVCFMGGVMAKDYTGNESDGTITIETVDGQIKVNGEEGQFVGYVYGRYDRDGKFEGDSITGKVTIKDTDISETVYGAYSSKDGIKIENSEVDLSGDLTVTYSVYGAWGSTDSTVTNNTVTIGKDVTVENDVYGGYGKGKEVSNNTVKINNATIGRDLGFMASGNVYGGQSEDGSKTLIKENSVEITDSTVFLSVYGGKAGNSSAEGNSVVISGSKTKIGKSVYGGQGVIANGNRVEMSGGTVEENVCGGYGYSGSEVKGNSVLLAGGTVEGNVYGGSGSDYGGYYTTDVMNNTVTIGSNTVVKGNVYGGYNENNGKVSGNTVYLQGKDTVKNNKIYGGYSKSGLVEGNTVYLKGNADISGSTIYGGYSESGTVGENYLVVEGQGFTAKTVENVDSISFSNIRFNDEEETTYKAGIKVDSINLEHTKIILTGIAGGQELEAGDTIDLVLSDKTIGEVEDMENQVPETVAAGVAQEVELEIRKSAESDAIEAVVTGVTINDQTYILGENRAAAAAFVADSAELLSYTLDTWSKTKDYGIQTYAVVKGTQSKYDVNSNIKLNGWETLVGMGDKRKTSKGDVSWGLFYESGTANYRTFNTFNEEAFRGDGSMTYTGGALGVRLDKENGFYAELGLRAGKLQSDMGAALKDGEGNLYGYHSDSAYYGGHIGIGKKYQLSTEESLDVYGKYFHTYTEGDSMVIGGDRFEFDGVQSNRIRVGVRYNKGTEVGLQVYYGLGYEYECSGEAHMRAAGFEAPEQSLQGSTYLGEIGFNYKETKETPWSWGGTLTGYAGEREGVSANLYVGYAF